MGTKALRATFEDVLVFQEKMRKKLDTLIAENRPLNGKKERDEFMGILARSTLGLGTNVYVQASSSGGVHDLGSVEVAARWLAYQEEKKIKLVGAFSSSNIEIGELWGILRDALFRVWPLALDRSTSISAERLPYEPTRAQRF